MAETARVRINTITQETYKALSDVEKQQFPYALAKTITEVAQIAVKMVQQRTRQEFDLKTEFIPKGIARTSAKKSDIRTKGEGTSVIFTKPLISGFMPIHERGGVRRPVAKGSGDRGKALSIPARDVLKRSYRTGRGAVRKQWKPSSLLEGYKQQRLPASVYSQVILGKVRKTKGRAFVTRLRSSGVAVIARRLTNYPMPIELLYVFSRRARYKGTWGFEKTVQVAVDLRFETRLKANLAIAVRTAR